MNYREKAEFLADEPLDVSRRAAVVILERALREAAANQQQAAAARLREFFHGSTQSDGTVRLNAELLAREFEDYAKRIREGTE